MFIESVCCGWLCGKLYRQQAYKTKNMHIQVINRGKKVILKLKGYLEVPLHGKSGVTLQGMAFQVLREL